MNAIDDRAQLIGSPRSRGRRLLGQLLLVATRVGATTSKFLLAIYTARYLGLADLGFFGLLMAATTIVPAAVGLGMTEWVMRKIVDLPRVEALPLIASRLSLTLCIHLVFQPLAFGLNILLGEPIPLRIAALSGVILLLDNLGNEAEDMLMARRRIFLSYFVTFLRAGAWPIPVMAIGLLYPETRTLEFLLLGWLGTLIVCWLILVGLVIPNGRWRYLRPQIGVFLRNLDRGVGLYIKDVSTTISMFLDRFLISIFLGLELTGVYTLFWSVANVVHSLAVYGVLQPQLPRLIATAQSGDRTSFRALERYLQIETGIWALLLTLGAAVATPLLIPYLDEPLVQDYLPIFWVILLATLLRVAADSYGYVLLAQHQDRAIATIAVGGAVVSAALNAILTPIAGLWGASAAYVITSGGLFAARFWKSRSLHADDAQKV